MIQTHQEILQRTAKEFSQSFLLVNSNAKFVESIDPCICWKNDSLLYFIAISAAFIDTPENCPLFLRLRLNLLPPIALCDEIKKKEFCASFGLVDPMIANDPVIELFALPEEIPAFAPWILAWCDSRQNNMPQVPVPPIALYSMYVDKKFNVIKELFTDAGENWIYKSYLWTDKTLKLYKEYLEPYYGRI